MSLDAELAQRPWDAIKPIPPPPEELREEVLARLQAASGRAVLVPAIDEQTVIVNLGIFPRDIDLASWEWRGGWWKVPGDGQVTRVKRHTSASGRIEVLEDFLINPEIVLTPPDSSPEAKPKTLIVGADAILDWLYSSDGNLASRDYLQIVGAEVATIRLETGE